MSSRFFTDRERYDAIRKDPDAVEDFANDWTAYLADDSDTISTSAWSVTSGKVTIDSDTNTTTKATVWLSGDPGTMSEVQNRIVTTAGRTKDWTMRVYGREK